MIISLFVYIDQPSNNQNQTHSKTNQKIKLVVGKMRLFKLLFAKKEHQAKQNEPIKFWEKQFLKNPLRTDIDLPQA